MGARQDRFWLAKPFAVPNLVSRRVRRYGHISRVLRRAVPSHPETPPGSDALFGGAHRESRTGNGSESSEHDTDEDRTLVRRSGSAPGWLARRDCLNRIGEHGADRYFSRG
jgi:hypothetical protein